ncbi:electron transfer flavoprotein subunit beta/FixA family protein [Serpentinicella alkaliphila]|uniref:Electron transfer flavoprotein small subunit n=1 Tax=Serpentinicella alkaliphila TaxID=1734049 RepID=A0A4R2TAU0_9FIRM|nr:electron transfer flavoprotein subunit beta/FixA family protein [Serpentinicella alkaliphila]QUH24782.1 electron transfer flavoprotein subunit beta/FixA family protein [Serpentinicella alkaliphila]TCP98991.1 electron transfer flavoprotein beta subunit [Serpentinicella alkaliphila]
MRIVVLIKQVPDMEKVKFNSEKGIVDRASAGTEINPFDLNALEAALVIKEIIGAEVVALTMGPPKAEEALREAIARGADKAVLISDKYFGGSDTKATSHVISSGIKRLGNFHLIIAGEKTVDGDTGQVGAQVSDYLDIPYITYVSRIEEVSESVIRSVSEIWGGEYLKEMKLPGLITVTKDINTPRLPSFKQKMASRKAEIIRLSYEDLKEYFSSDEVGIKGSPTWVSKIEVPEVIKREGKIYRDDIDAGLETILHIIAEERI